MVLNAKFRMAYILCGIIGYIFLFYYMMDTLPYSNYAEIMLIAAGDMVFFALAYKTYPANETRRIRRRAYSTVS